jgi:hypothetical protein
MKRNTDFTRLERDWGIISVAMDYMPAEFKHDFAGASRRWSPRHPPASRRS